MARHGGAGLQALRWLAAIAAAAADPGVRSEWSPEFVEQAVTEVWKHGDARRGAGVFADDRVPAAFWDQACSATAWRS